MGAVVKYYCSPMTNQELFYSYRNVFTAILFRNYPYFKSTVRTPTTRKYIMPSSL